MMGFRSHSRPGSASTAKHTSRDRDLLAEECVRGAPADRRNGVVQGRMGEWCKHCSRRSVPCNFLVAYLEKRWLKRVMRGSYGLSVVGAS